MSRILVVGGGASGMLTAIYAARNGHNVSLYEKNEKLGKKLYVTGKGRCNITNASDMDVIFDNMMSNKKFLYSCFYSYTNQDVMNFFEDLGCKVKVERGNRVFPVSDKSSDVIQALSRELQRLGVQVHLRKAVKKLIVENDTFVGLQLEGSNEIIKADKVIIATGGLSYPATGSTGDGYEFAKELGHSIKSCTPSLVPFNIKEDFVKELQGLALKNVSVKIKDQKKTIYENFGEMLFTHFGVSGPLILSGSSYVAAYKKKENLDLWLDLKPALTKEQLDQRILRDFEENINKQFKNSLDHLLPKKIIPVIISLCEIDPDKKVNFITKEERGRLIQTMKELKLTIESLRSYREAVITKGGVAVKEINPTSMESKLVKNVHFVGEVLDLDALTGGFNLQIAWSTAYAAATNLE